MRATILLVLCMTFMMLLTGVDGGALQWDYIVVGAGPGGLQMAHFLHKANRSYVVLERGDVAGNFFKTYPRHDKIISINKRATGQTNKEFNFRHDWNSLISDDESLLMRHYSTDYFPDRRELLQYLHDFGAKLNVQYQTEVSNVARLPTGNFTMRDQHGRVYACRHLIMATGMWKPLVPNWPGAEYMEGYDTVSTNPDDFEGQTVLIFGHGNSAFELADSIYKKTSMVHVVGRSRVRLSWETHYVGDIRGVNNALLDAYQLKSLDGIVSVHDISELMFTKNKAGKLLIQLNGDDDNEQLSKLEYDRVIYAIGFTFDSSIFNETTLVSRGEGAAQKYPLIGFDYQSRDQPGLYFAGTVTHSLDHKKSAGGFIHGYRYTARVLHYLLEWKNHGVPWPSTLVASTDLLTAVLKRVNEASGLYQMFSVLADVMVVTDNGRQVEYFEEFPVRLLPTFAESTGRNAEHVILLQFQYGPNYSGPATDVFKEDRANIDPAEANKSNFLHPVLYYYDKIPTNYQMASKGMNNKKGLPRPKRIHHISEDLLTSWTLSTHVWPLRHFLQTVLDDDLRNFDVTECFRVMLTRAFFPRTCENHVLAGRGVTA